MSKVQEFTLRAKKMYEQAQSRGEEVYGIKPWYSSVSLIENGTDIAFIGANPGGGRIDQTNDERLGYLQLPYDESQQYQAWLDDMHWGDKDLQERAIEAFEILFGSRGRDTLRNTASFNVVPMRSKVANKLSRQTWNEGVNWCIDVVANVKPKTIICLGNGEAKSAWSVFKRDMTEVEKRPIYNNFSLKRGRANFRFNNALVIGLPHLSRVHGMQQLRKAAKGWEIK